MSRKDSLKKEIQAGAEKLLHVSESDDYLLATALGSAASERLSGRELAVFSPDTESPMEGTAGAQHYLISKVDDGKPPGYIGIKMNQTETEEGKYN